MHASRVPRVRHVRVSGALVLNPGVSFRGQAGGTILGAFATFTESALGVRRFAALIASASSLIAVCGAVPPAGLFLSQVTQSQLPLSLRICAATGVAAASEIAIPVQGPVPRVLGG